jgi:hypothetical protein
MGKIAAFGTLLQIGTQQVDTGTVIGTISGSGNATVIVTAAGMTGSPITTSVAVLNGDSADAVATKIVTALNLVANITAWLDVYGSGATVVIRRKIAAANDTNLNISIANGTCSGLTAAPTSANTTTGVDYVTVASITNIGGPGLAADTLDVSTHDDATAWEDIIPSLLRSGEVSTDLLYDPNAASHSTASNGMLDRYQNKKPTNVKITFPGPYSWTFPSLVTGFEPSGPADGALTATAKFKITGAPILV